MPTSIDEKRKSLANSKSEILEGRVIANYGDVGLSQNYHFDLLSRFVIVYLESVYSVPTVDKWSQNIVAVARPEHLWISASEGKAASINSQVREDSLGNTSVGVAGSFGTNGIGGINRQYQLGELIKIKKLPVSFNLTSTAAFFLSVFPDSDDASLTYGSSHSDGSTLPLFSSSPQRILELERQTIYQPNADLPLQYGIRLWKSQYEAFMLNLTLSDSNMSSYLSKVFDNNIPSSDSIYQGHGGYVFSENSFINLNAVEFVDINIDNKNRELESSCIPLVVASPGVWPSPKQRTLSTISYNPSYSTIITQ